MTEGLKLVSDAAEKGWKIKTLVFGKSLASEIELKQRVDMLAAKVLASAGQELFTNRGLIRAARKELVQRRGKDFKYSALLGDRLPPLDYRN